MTINSKDKRDHYYFMAKNNGYRARSVYKLLNIQEKYKIFDNARNVVDLCSAPGSWTQCIIRNFENVENVISIDIQEIEPFEKSKANVHVLREDITSEKCFDSVKSLDLDIDTIVCDGAPDVTRFHDLDQFIQFDLLISGLKFCLNFNVKTFVSKMFRGEYTGILLRHFKKYFKTVFITKPRASKGNLRECFIICKDIYNTDENFDKIDFTECICDENYGCESCGYGEDPDYSFEEVTKSEIYKNSKPINAVYEKAIRERKNN